MVSRSPVDDNAGLVAQFAETLDALRRQAGGLLTFQQMSRQLRGIPSASTLNRAVSGAKLPSWKNVLAFVTSCGGDVEHWRQQQMRASAALSSGHTQELVFTTYPTSSMPEKPALLTVDQALSHSASQTMDHLVLELKNAVENPSTAVTKIGKSQLGDFADALSNVWTVLSYPSRPVSTPEEFTLCMKVVKEHSRLSFEQISKRTNPARLTSQERQVLGCDGLGIKSIPVSTLADLCNPQRARLPNPSTLGRFLNALGYPDEDRSKWEAIRADLAARYDRRYRRSHGTRPKQTRRKPSVTRTDRPIFGSFLDQDLGAH